VIARVIPMCLAASLHGCVVEYTVPAETGTGTDDGLPGTSSGGDDPCAAGRDPCGGACFDLASDPEHCGSCETACAAAQVCDAGECVAECRDGRDACARACVDFDGDPFHCGQCNEVCELGGECVAGDCKDACGDTCAEAREVCVDQECVCRPGFASCGGTCVDLDTDPSHCGECGRDCEGSPCGDGECQAAGCEGFADQCGASCTDVSSDPLHCGECGDTCEGDEVCVEGDCDDLG
jgi:hypothetical protein